MKIAVVGCGAVGSFYGAKLCFAGQQVHFLLRTDYETVRRRGLLIRSAGGDFRVQPKCARTPEEIGPCDLVLVALKTTALDQYPRLLPPLVTGHTAVVTLQNGLGNEEQFAKLFPFEQILGGLCFVCLNRIEPGLVQHIDHGRVVFGEFQRWPEPRTHDIASIFRRAGVPCEVTDNLARAHWEKLAWNIPFNGLGVASSVGFENVLAGTVPTPPPGLPCLTTDLLLGDPRWEKLVRELMSEVIRVAQALGHDIPDQLAAKQIELTRTMGAYQPSTVIDFQRGQPLELESMFLLPKREAERGAVTVPRLQALCSVLQVLDPAR